MFNSFGARTALVNFGPTRILVTAMSLLLVPCLVPQCLAIDDENNSKWASRVELPAGETPKALFDGHSFHGWQGRIGDYWTIEDGVIVGRNRDVVPASTYLLTDQEYRNFRLLMEVKQTVGSEYSTMHSAVCCLGKIIEDQQQPFGFRGPLLMFCHDWGIWDAHRRNRIFPPGHKGSFRPDLEKTGDWNQIEILVIANRIRMVANGRLVIDMTDQPEMLQASPIGLQLHSNKRPQEYRFRGLLLSEHPQDRLLTLKSE